MYGVHDLGGRPGFGPVALEADEPVFHEDWEARVHGLAAAAIVRGLFGTPEFRYAIERMQPEHYLSASYYERWLTAVATLLAEKEIVTREDLAASVDGAFPLSTPNVAPRLEAPGPDVTDARFAPGDRVVVRDFEPAGHTRCPSYVRGKPGAVVRYDGPCNFDDVEARANGKRLEPLYCVRFDAVELWGDAAEGNTAVHVDLFESYLDAA